MKYYALGFFMLYKPLSNGRTPLSLALCPEPLQHTRNSEELRILLGNLKDAGVVIPKKYADKFHEIRQNIKSDILGNREQ